MKKRIFYFILPTISAVVVVTLLGSHVIALPITSNPAVTMSVLVLGTDQTFLSAPAQKPINQSQVVTINDSTLASIPVLNDAVHKAFDMRGAVGDNNTRALGTGVWQGARSYVIEISQTDANSIMQLAGAENKGHYDMPYTDKDYATNQNVQISRSGLTLDYQGYYYGVSINQISPS
jgi:hypothetical protein